MRRLLLALVAILAGCHSSQVVPPPPAPPPPPQVPPTLSWTDTGNPAQPACTAANTKSCIFSYTIEEDGTYLAMVQLGTNAYTLPSVPSSGTHTFQLYVNGFDQSGNLVSSPPASATVSIP